MPAGIPEDTKGYQGIPGMGGRWIQPRSDGMGSGPLARDRVMKME